MTARAPKLNRRLTLEERRKVADGGGGWTETWAPLGILWAGFDGGSAAEVTVGDREVSRLRRRVYVRAAPQGAPERPRADQRFREGARIFDIRGVAEEGDDGRLLVCWVEEGGAT